MKPSWSWKNTWAAGILLLALSLGISSALSSCGGGDGGDLSSAFSRVSVKFRE